MDELKVNKSYRNFRYRKNLAIQSKAVRVVSNQRQQALTVRHGRRNGTKTEWCTGTERCTGTKQSAGAKLWRQMQSMLDLRRTVRVECHTSEPTWVK